jgi:ABC-type Mn2+/Zn2+ transport system ATPase subunit
VNEEQPVITCESVCLGYGDRDVLSDVCLSVRRGVFLPFVGPNGAGKTTLLRAMLGLLKVRKGRIQTPFDAKPPGYVPQQRMLDPIFPITAWELVAMGLYPRVGWFRRPSRAERQTVDAALAEFSLDAHAGKTFSELSGGMKQKALIARAFAGGAEVFIMDEPTSELDEPSEREVLEHLSRLVRERGRTVLIAHHGMDHINKLGPEVCLVDRGRAELLRVEEARRRMEER